MRVSSSLVTAEIWDLLSLLQQLTMSVFTLEGTVYIYFFSSGAELKDQDFVMGTCLDKLVYTLFFPFVFPWLLQDYLG